MFHLIWLILIGFVIGVIAKLIHPGKENMGFVMTTLLGIGGSVAMSYLGQILHIYRAGEKAGFIGSVIGAVLLLLAYGYIKKK
jgi:uncharacterized membrane protein YeaQ/YmgE (transglycosylase-associated protein family)